MSGIVPRRLLAIMVVRLLAVVAGVWWWQEKSGDGGAETVVAGASVGEFTKRVDSYIEATSDPATPADVDEAIPGDEAWALVVAAAAPGEFVAARLVRSHDAGMEFRLVWAVQSEPGQYFYSCPAPDGTPPAGWCPTPDPVQMFRLDYIDAHTGEWLLGMERGIDDLPATQPVTK